jgi:LysM repeat protein
MKHTLLRTIILCLAAFLVHVPIDAQAPWNQRYQDYIDQYKDLAIEEMLRYNIPASITLAQGLLESSAGRSELAVKGNNHFGIKCHDWSGRTVYHDDDARQECFRAYSSVIESYEDHSKFLRSGRRYAFLFMLDKTDYKGWAYGLKSAGYATNPSYANLLINIIETYGLHEYDKAHSYDKFRVEHQPKNMFVSPQTGLHSIKMCNKNYYVIARRGDTFRSIGEEVGISYRRLARYNERDKNDALQDGDIIYLKKKRSKANRSFRNVPHVVKAGESMYLIAQKYGIQLKSLYKKNGLSPDYRINVGDRLRVY